MAIKANVTEPSTLDTMDDVFHSTEILISHCLWTNWFWSKSVLLFYFWFISVDFQRYDDLHSNSALILFPEYTCMHTYLFKLIIQLVYIYTIVWYNKHALKYEEIVVSRKFTIKQTKDKEKKKYSGKTWLILCSYTLIDKFWQNVRPKPMFSAFKKLCFLIHRFLLLFAF